MKTNAILAGTLAALVFANGARGQDPFVPGNIFVAAFAGEECEPGMGSDVIVEIDPATGATSVFADLDDGLCRVNGLRFTPDGQRLFALNAGRIFFPASSGWVQAFNPDGTSEVILDESDGLRRPFGANALAFDAAGNLYVLNSSSSTVLRFPADGGPGTVFADSSDGIRDRGALDFAPNDDLFYCGDLVDAIIRITPEGDSSLFDTLPSPSSLAFDRQGNLFVAAGQAGVGATIYRYDDGDPSSRRILVDGFLGESGLALPVTLSPDGSVVYLVELSGTVYKIDAEDGTTTVLANFWDLLPGPGPSGITVYAPPPPIPTVSEWGLAVMGLILVTAAVVLIRRQVRRVHVQFNERRVDFPPFVVRG